MAGPSQQWRCWNGGVQAVVKTGQPWEAALGRWQCDVNITIVNRGKRT